MPMGTGGLDPAGRDRRCTTGVIVLLCSTGDPVLPEANGDPALPDTNGVPALPEATGDPALPEATGDPALPETNGIVLMLRFRVGVTGRAWPVKTCSAEAGNPSLG